MLTEGDIRMTWLTVLHPFGTVEVLERTPYFDTGARGLDWPSWLAVCVGPSWRAYTGRLVVVREFRARTVYVIPSDQPHVLYSECGDDVPTFAFDRWSQELAQAGLLDLVEQAFTPPPAPPVTYQAPRRAWSCRLHSVRFGPATVDVDDADKIVNASGQYAVLIGMDFYAFIRGLKQSDSTIRYRRLDQGDA